MELAKHEAMINEVVAHYLHAKVEIVTDVAEWCAEHSGGKYGASELDNPIGKALWNSPVEPSRILLRNVVTQKQIEDHLLALYLRGFKDVYDRLSDNIAFLKHLVLHEIAHIKHDLRQEREADCDRWAFDELEQWIKT